ncbi:hypothetical protein [Azomonas macrocytogenes]|uniref:Lipoprotein n=1 Tax=Azomonas macrocytogenes TaxID=69962 RepID=A0A839TAU5_AZOMA|nr:hypothetical protein [Azomonas macrocytogenes]MBB3105165.1 hypothetical protein [Azomonas macrocytogenes]
MKQLSKTLLASLGIMILTGCATTAPEPQPYDPTKSRALNLAYAAGLDRLTDQEIPKEQGQHITDSLAYNALWAHTNFVSPAPGFSSFGAGALSVAGWLFAPKEKEARNSLVAWMPKTMARTPEEAEDKMLDIVKEAIDKGLTDLGVDFYFLYKTRKSISAVSFLINDAAYGCPQVKPEDSILNICGVTFIVREPLIGKTSTVVSEHEYPTYFFDPRPDVKYSKIFIEQTANSKLPEQSIYAAISKHLPKWVLLYLAANEVKQKDASKIPFPYILQQGKAELFIKPAAMH